MKHIFFLALIFVINSGDILAQDTLSFHNGNQIIGELKSLDRGVLVFKTDYSDSDFKIEWSGVENVSTATLLLITLSDGERLTGSIVKGDSNGLTLNVNGGVIIVPADNIVYLKSLDQGIWSQIYANVDVGFSITKAKNLRQLNISSGLGYLGENWAWDARFNSLNSSQDSVSTTKRTDGGVTANIFLPKDWFVTGSVDFLSNTEQLLDLRLNGRAGMGYYFVHSNRWYWSFAGGVAVISESYSSGENGKESMEGFIGTELNLFDIGDFNFFTKVIVYPGITERGRVRSDFNLDLKYDLPHDFYFKGGVVVNYDNQPAVGAGEMDYVLNTGFGWEW